MNSEHGGRLRTGELTLAYGSQPVVTDLSLGLPDGQVTTIIGANACGKSTLLRALARLMKPSNGAVYFDGQAIHRLPAKEVARRLGLLAQQSNAPEGVTVEDLVRRGRYPHQSFLQPPSRDDHEAVERALELTGMQPLRHRPVDELSGGQRQRAWIAMALAQDTPVLLLDEPTTYLDIAHQHEVLSLVRRLNREEGRTVVMVLHDINEAAAVSDRIVALRDGAVLADGAPDEVLRPELLERVFGVECDVVAHPRDSRPVSIPRSRLARRGSRTPEVEPRGELRAHGLRLGYGKREVVPGLSTEIPAGEVTVIVGANACGKSTVLRALGRLVEPRAGQAMLDGRDVHRYRHREFARRVGVLPQSPVPPPDLLVEDLVAAGRYPHQRWYRQWSRADARAVERALAATGTEDLRGRPVAQLSGGQRQRAFLAMTLAREAPVLLLDEPTTFLDIAHQVEVLDLVREANRERGVTVLMVLHDLALACRYADRLIAMKDGAVVAAGTPAEVMTPELVQAVFGVEACVVENGQSGAPLVLPVYGHRDDGGRQAVLAGRAAVEARTPRTRAHTEVT
ncbi:MAG: ABC transporter ATP-binding protein [Dehalococcoidia bacterium]|nr:ABC transporter ATP-binding protein [Dehalococcoidia bacterium]